jgi:hypothetical protein
MDTASVADPHLVSMRNRIQRCRLVGQCGSGADTLPDQGFDDKNLQLEKINIF